ncbi:MAG: QacE family quaternary ammonium compound efflux SMR transporter, partial [Alphaproteobacteria bacterium]|nr:QacE family quaternary ammonium compound efflux SMR transporter [Alphaproteobacteria bacterium]
MSWFYLFMAGIFEIFWAVGIKYCDGFKITISFV